MNLAFKGTLTKQEYVDIITLISSRVKENVGRRGKIAKWSPTIILFTMAVIVGVGTLWYGISKGNNVVSLTAIGPILMIILILASLRGRKRISASAQAEVIWRNEANRKLVLEGTVIDEGIAMKFQGGESLAKWNAFVGYGEYKDILVLLQPTKAFLSIPKRFFGKQEDWTAFRDIVRDKLNVTHRVDNHANGAVGGQ